MAGCGGCGPEGCNGPCSTKREQPRSGVSLAEALAKVIVDNRVIKFTLDYSRDFPMATVDEIVVAATAAKEKGEL